MANLYENVGAIDYNDIIASAPPTAHVATIKLAASQGVLPRGAVVSGTAGGEMTELAAAIASGADVFVLCDETDTGTSGAVYAFAYKTGNFVRQRLVTNGYALVAADYKAMRDAGLITTDAAVTTITEEE